MKCFAPIACDNASAVHPLSAPLSRLHRVGALQPSFNLMVTPTTRLSERESDVSHKLLQAGILRTVQLCFVELLLG